MSHRTTYSFNFHHDGRVVDHLAFDIEPEFVTARFPSPPKGCEWRTPGSLLDIPNWAVARVVAQFSAKQTVPKHALIHLDVYATNVEKEQQPQQPVAPPPPSSWAMFRARTKTYGKPEWLFVCAFIMLAWFVVCIVNDPYQIPDRPVGLWAIVYGLLTGCLFVLPYLVRAIIEDNRKCAIVNRIAGLGLGDRGRVVTLCDLHNYDQQKVLRELLK